MGYRSLSFRFERDGMRCVGCFSPWSSFKSFEIRDNRVFMKAKNGRVIKVRIDEVNRDTVEELLKEFL